MIRIGWEASFSCRFLFCEVEEEMRFDYFKTFLCDGKWLAGTLFLC